MMNRLASAVEWIAVSLIVISSWCGFGLALAFVLAALLRPATGGCE